MSAKQSRTRRTPKRSATKRSAGKPQRTWNVVADPLTGHTVQHTRTAAGTDVWVAPMKGFQRRYAAVTARYGSVDTHLPDGLKLPVGAAHFLEHQMFQSPQGDVFDLFAARGASANAYTTFTHTSYLFSCTTGFDQNLQTLLGAVAAVETTPESVEREKGIIGQEIAMYADDADWRGYFDLLGALYRKHPLRTDIAGTDETIAPVDRSLLERIHEAYYAPRNLVVTVAGDVDPDQVADQAASLLARKGPRRNRAPVEEPDGVRRKRVTTHVPIERPQITLGIKDQPPGRGRALLRRRILTRVVLEAVFGDGGRIEAPMRREGTIDDSFSASYEAEPDAAFAIMGGETDDIEATRGALTRAMKQVAATGLTAQEVERARRKLTGMHVRLFNAPSRVANWMLSAALEGVSPSMGAQTLATVSARAVNQRMRDLFAAPHAWSILLPRSDAAHSAS